jgi:hypothetical protein
VSVAPRNCNALLRRSFLLGQRHAQQPVLVSGFHLAFVDGGIQREHALHRSAVTLAADDALALLLLGLALHLGREHDRAAVDGHVNVFLLRTRNFRNDVVRGVGFRHVDFERQCAVHATAERTQKPLKNVAHRFDGEWVVTPELAHDSLLMDGPTGLGGRLIYRGTTGRTRFAADQRRETSPSRTRAPSAPGGSIGPLPERLDALGGFHNVRQISLTWKPAGPTACSAEPA